MPEDNPAGQQTGRDINLVGLEEAHRRINLDHAEPVVKVPLAQQLAWFDEYADTAIDMIALRLRTMRREIKAGARQRGIDGFPIYGDSLCHKPSALPDLDEELMDAVWYGAEHLRRRG